MMDIKMLRGRLDDDQHDRVMGHIRLSNRRRMTTMLAVVTLITIGLLVMDPRTNLATHIAVLAVSLPGALVFGLSFRKDRALQSPEESAIVPRRVPDMLIPPVITFLLTVLAFHSGLNQLAPYPSIATFVAALLFSAAVITTPGSMGTLSYGIPWVVFVAGVSWFQKDMTVLTMHLAQGTIAFGGALLLARRGQIDHYSQLAKTELLRDAQVKIEYLARHDPLTGLANRRAFEEHFSRALAAARRHRYPLSIVLVDVDNFKGINDRYGHPAGDEVLKGIARVLSDSIRDIDIAARWGGEEFVLLLPHTPSDGAMITAERARLALHNLITYDVTGHSIRCTASFGVADVPSGDLHPLENAYAAADRALYWAKEHGRDLVESAVIEFRLPLDEGTEAIDLPVPE